jgi:PAS domain S-box-containing protein
LSDFVQEQSNGKAITHHVCNIYRNIDEQFKVMISFLQTGLKNNEKCLIILHNEKKEKFFEQIQKESVFSSNCSKDQIEFYSTKDFFIEKDHFSAYRSLLVLKEIKNRAISQGFTNLRVISEMSWALLNGQFVTELFLFEKYVSEFCLEDDCTFLDQFMLYKINLTLLSEVYALHPTVILGTEFINKTTDNFDDMSIKELVSNFSKGKHGLLNNNLTPDCPKIDYAHIWKVIYHSKTPALVIGEEERIIDYNASMQRLTGHYPEKALDLSSWLLKIIPDEKNRKKIHKLIKNAKNQELTESTCIIEIRNTNDVKKYVEFIAYNIYENNKPTDLHILQGVDVTSKIEKENLLLFQAQLLENLQESIIALNLDNKIIYWGKGAEKLYGYQVDEVLGSQITVIFPSLEKEKEIKRIQDLEKTNNSWKGQCQQIKKDGTIFWAGSRLSLVKDKDGIPCGFLRVDIDISGYKQIEDDLSLSEQKFRNIYNSSPLGMLQYQLMDDDRLVLIGANPAADVILGLDTRQFIGKTIEEAFPPLVKTEIPEKYRLVAQTGTEYRVEQIDYEDDQIKGIYEVVAFQTEPMKIVASFCDITQLKQVKEKQLNFMNDVSHEIRTPLTIIQGSAEFLKKHSLTIDHEECEKFLDTILRNAVRLERLAHNLDRLMFKD